MAKKELIAYVSEHTGMTKKDAERVFETVFASITEALKTEGKVQISGFGTFEVKERAAHVGINPSTKAPIEIPASKTVGFKVGKNLKDSVQ